MRTSTHGRTIQPGRHQDLRGTCGDIRGPVAKAGPRAHALDIAVLQVATVSRGPERSALWLRSSQESDSGTQGLLSIRTPPPALSGPVPFIWPEVARSDRQSLAGGHCQGLFWKKHVTWVPGFRPGRHWQEFLL